jgi:hypothetical protein
MLEHPLQPPRIDRPPPRPHPLSILDHIIRPAPAPAPQQIPNPATIVDIPQQPQLKPPAFLCVDVGLELDQVGLD